MLALQPHGLAEIVEILSLRCRSARLLVEVEGFTEIPFGVIQPVEGKSDRAEIAERPRMPGSLDMRTGRLDEAAGHAQSIHVPGRQLGCALAGVQRSESVVEKGRRADLHPGFQKATTTFSPSPAAPFRSAMAPAISPSGSFCATRAVLGFKQALDAPPQGCLGLRGQVLAGLTV